MFKDEIECLKKMFREFLVEIESLKPDIVQSMSDSLDSKLSVLLPKLVKLTAKHYWDFLPDKGPAL